MRASEWRLAYGATKLTRLLWCLEQGVPEYVVDWSRVQFEGEPVPYLTTAATFPGHEPDISDLMRHATRDLPRWSA